MRRASNEYTAFTRMLFWLCVPALGAAALLYTQSVQPKQEADAPKAAPDASAMKETPASRADAAPVDAAAPAAEPGPQPEPERAEVFSAPGADTEVALDAKGNLRITDRTGTGKSGTVTLCVNDAGTDLLVSDEGADAVAHTAVPMARITGERIAVNLGKGDDTLTLDVSGGLLATPIEYDGGDDFDTLVYVGEPKTPVDETVYSPGPEVTEGRVLHIANGGAQELSVHFRNLEPVQTNVGTGTLTVNCTNANNAATYSNGPGGGIFTGNTGLVSVDGFETIEFNNATVLAINGLDGADTITLAATALPVGLSDITVNGDIGSDTTSVDGNPSLPGTLTLNTEAITLNATALTASTALALNGEVTLTDSHSLVGATSFAAGFTTFVDGATAGTEYGQAVVTGTVNLTGSALTLTGGYAPAFGDQIVLIDNDGADAVTGTFAGLADGDSVSVGAFKGAITYVGGDGNDVVLVAVTDDFGDAPNSYGTTLGAGGAHHTLGSGLVLGFNADAEPDGLPNATATGDDADNASDEDGVLFFSSLARGAQAQVAVVASGAGKLNAWVDFDQNGVFDHPSEQIFADRAMAGGPELLSFAVPGGAQLGTTYARFRLDSTGGLTPTGAASDGEVEDQQVTVSGASADLSITKDDDGEFAAPGKTTVYTLVAANAGPSDATGVTITETVPAGTTFDAANSTPGWVLNPDSSAGSTATFSVGALASGTDSGDILFAVVADDPLSGISQIDNTASVAGNETDGNGANDSASVSTLANEFPLDDIDGDGIPNAEDSDIDGDGFNNLRDLDRDGDGVNNDLDPSPDDPTDAGPFGMTGVAGLAVRSMRVKLDFDDTGKDKIKAKGTVPMPTAGSLAGTTVDVDLGGQTQSFTLDDRGTGTTGSDKFKLRVRKKAGANGKFLGAWTLSMRSGTYTIVDANTNPLDDSAPGVADRVLLLTLEILGGAPDLRYNVGTVEYKSTPIKGTAKTKKPSP